MRQRTFSLDPPPHLVQTLGHLNGGTGHPTRRPTRTEAWRASRTPLGPATLHLRVSGTRVSARAWGPGAEWALDQAPELLGSHDEPDAVPVHHPLIRELRGRFLGMRMARTLQVHAALVPVILGQVVTIKEAKRAEARLNRAFGEPAPGPHQLWLQPSPEALASQRYEDFHPLGIGRNKAELIIEVSRRARRLEEAASMSSREAEARLRAIRGIGPWSAALVIGEVLGDADAVPTGDYHLPNTVAWALAGEDRGTDKRMLELLEPYRPHRKRVTLMLKKAGISAPKYGPKAPIRSFETS